MRKLHAKCPECEITTSWTIETILSQYMELCLAECSCNLCGTHELISFKLPTIYYISITEKGFEIKEEEPPPHETTKPPFLE